MKKYTIIFTLLIGLSSFISCDSSESDNEEETRTEWRCGTHNGKLLWTGPQGGCYYKNSNGNKTYVDRSECNC
ncbi:hypothetical protein [Jejuia spongiicola]|uniref:Uncharacterized protein n=1 Tax=Jejuia spongiicola TaxID=2942207 RepID=A0ABT0QJX1_9FLAO|nr:hypothetical protein [Jejuia spongiicola]MCL6296275.1 hypothetical protein [Jejuia spongiicola]